MSLPQLIGLQCVACQKSISSIIDGAFCEDCGNPVHRKCIGSAQQAQAELCPLCGGDRGSTVAQEVRREREAEAQAAATNKSAFGVSNTSSRRQVRLPEPDTTAPIPVSGTCPKCGSAQFTRVRPKSWVTFVKDRVCSQCGTRYTPPTPLWAAFVFLIAGLILTGFGVVGLIAGDVCMALLGLLGIGALIQGIRSLASPGKV